MKIRYCPFDKSELQFGGEFAGFYLICPNCSILYSFRENVSKEELIKEAIYLTQNNFQRLKEIGYTRKEISKIKELKDKARLEEQLANFGQLKLNFF